MESGAAGLIGISPRIVALRSEVERVAHSDARVLITGESGVGKEIVARAIYTLSPRRAAAFVPVNCGGITETLLESELFGHVKGSFTGAYRDKSGKLELASGGTIFLDEIGEMTIRMQSLFLRFLETGEIHKVGAERIGTATNVRVIAATNRNLRSLINEGQFREDLFYRLNVIHLELPALRERREDIPVLIDHFLSKFTSGINSNGGRGKVHGTHMPEMAPDALAVLSQYSWPGNVRQLQNLVLRLAVTRHSSVIRADDLPFDVLAPSKVGVRPLHDRRRTVADELFRKLVEDGESFWTAVYPSYMNRQITRSDVRDLVHKALRAAKGNYKIVLQMFNMDARDYKRFLNFLRKHGCRLPFKEYRQ